MKPPDREILRSRTWLSFASALLTFALMGPSALGYDGPPIPLVAPIPGAASAPAPDATATPVIAAPTVIGKAGILVDPRSGAILWEREAHVRRPIASLTKVMTALLILESKRLDEVVTASPIANKTGESAISLAVGEKVTLRDLLWAILLHSANDACVAAAEHLGGSVPKFVDRMNRRAGELGLKDTHFVTPNGLHTPLLDPVRPQHHHARGDEAPAVQ